MTPAVEETIIFGSDVVTSVQTDMFGLVSESVTARKVSPSEELEKARLEMLVSKKSKPRTLMVSRDS